MTSLRKTASPDGLYVFYLQLKVLQWQSVSPFYASLRHA
jgi:hypothetical protein